MLGDSPNDRSHANTDTSDKATSVDATEAALSSADHEDHDTDGPDEGENAGGPDTSNAITDGKGTATSQFQSCRLTNRQLTSEHHRQSQSGPWRIHWP